jgi:hypothetical protein
MKRTLTAVTRSVATSRDADAAVSSDAAAERPSFGPMASLIRPP